MSRLLLFRQPLLVQRIGRYTGADCEEKLHRSMMVKLELVKDCVVSLQSQVVTICTARFNIQQFYVLPTQCIYVFCVDLRTNSDYFPIQH